MDAPWEYFVLTRNAYLMMAWGPDIPDESEWNAEHEVEVPECFQRPLLNRRSG